MNKKLFMLLFYTLSNLSSSELEFKNVKQYTLRQDISPFVIVAKQYQLSYKKKDFIKFFLNRKKYLLKHLSFQNGYFKGKNTKFFFQKAYKLNSKIHFLNVKGKINNNKIKAKEIIFDKKNLFKLIKCEVQTPKSTLRRKELFLRY